MQEVAHESAPACAPDEGPDDRALDSIAGGAPQTARGPRSGAPRRRADDPTLAAQPAVQSREARRSASSDQDRIYPHAGPGRAPPRTAGLAEWRMAQRLLPRIRRLH